MFGGTMSPGLIFLVQALVVVALPVAILRFSRLKGRVPLVVVQIVVGLALGPSLFGRLAPDYYQLFFNEAALLPLSGIGAVAVLVFGLITGLHLDAKTFRGNGAATFAVAFANIVVPTALGCAGGLWILARHPEEVMPGISPLEFAVAFGICIGMTALPVVGALLSARGLLGRPICRVQIVEPGLQDAVLGLRVT